MSYAVLSDALRLLGRAGVDLDEEDVITPEDATGIGEHTAGRIDTVLAGAGYSIPITAPPHFLAHLRGLHAYGWAADLLTALFQAGSGINSEEAVEQWTERFEKGLEKLPDLLTGNLGAAPPDLATSLWSEDPDNSEPTLTTDMEW